MPAGVLTPAPSFVRDAISPEQIDEVATNLLALEAYCAGAPIIRVVQHPFWTQLMRQWDDGFLIYDMMDDHSGFLGNGAWLPEQNKSCLRRRSGHRRSRYVGDQGSGLQGVHHYQKRGRP